MTQRSAAWRYGWRLGLVAAGFAALQVLVMAGAGQAAAAEIRTLQFSLNNITYPGSALGPLVIMVLLTYLAMVLSGIVMLYLAHQAGQLAVSVSARQDDGGLAGLWVAVVSGALWIALSLLVVGLGHVDGSLSGVFTANPAGPLHASELIALAAQEAFLALVGIGLGALAGSRGGAAAMTRLAPTRPPTWTSTPYAAWGPYPQPWITAPQAPTTPFPPSSGAPGHPPTQTPAALARPFVLTQPGQAPQAPSAQTPSDHSAQDGQTAGTEPAK